MADDTVKDRPSLLYRNAWLAIPAVIGVIAALWIAGIKTAWNSQPLVLLTHYGGVAMDVLIAASAAFSFLANGQLSVLMLGCGMLAMAIGASAMPVAMGMHDIGTGFAIYNTSVLLGALSSFTGVFLTSRGKIRFNRPGLLLAHIYIGAIVLMGLVILLAFSGHMPVFFIEGQGGTFARALVLVTGVFFIALTSALLWQANRRTPSRFFYWYSIGMAMLAAGLAGSMLVVVQDSPLHWAARCTQIFAVIYLCAGALASLRENRGKGITLEDMESAWKVKEFLLGLRKLTLRSLLVRYGLAIAASAAAVALRFVLIAWAGQGLATYILFYPAVMAAAILGGFGPGMLATLLTALAADYWFIPPYWSFALLLPVDRLGMAIFIIMGFSVSLLAYIYRRNRDKAAAYDRNIAVQEGEERFKLVTEKIPTGLIMTRVGDSRIVFANPAYHEMFGLKPGELNGMHAPDLYQDPAEREKLLLAMKGQGYLKDYHVRFKRHDGKIFPVSLDAQYTEYKGEKVLLGAAVDITERLKAEEALHTALTRFYLVLSGMPDGVLLVTEDSRVEFANQAFCGMFGLSDFPDDLRNLTAGEIIEKIRPAYANGESAVSRITEITGQGKPVKDEEVGMRGGRTFLRNFIPIYLGNSRYGRLWVHKDITERKQAENAARQKQEELSEAQSIAHVGSWYWDAATDVTTGSDELLRIFGFDPNTESMPNFNNQKGLCYPNKDWELVNAAVQETMRTGRGYELDVRAIRSGELIWVTTRSAVVRGADGRITGLRGTVQDITERKRAEEAVWESEEKYRRLFNNMTEEVHFWKLVRDEDGKIKTWRLVDANPPAQKTWGKAREEIVGKTTDEIFGPGAAEHYMPVVQKIFAEMQPYHYEDYFPNLDRYFRFTSIPFGEYYITTGADITGYKKAEKVLKHDKEEIEKLVQERTQELMAAQKELFNAKRLSELGTLAATIAHELRNPLAAINVAAYNVRKKAKNPDLEKHLGNIDKKVVESSQIIDNLLAYSRPKPPHRVKTDLHGLIEETMEQFREKSKQDIKVSGNIGSLKGIIIEADPLQIKEVLNNILNNAHDAVSPEKGKIEIKAKNDGKSATITIRDNGSGIERENMTKIFDPFFSTKSKGTGLGLAVCRQIMDLHDGSINIESEPGRGTAVSVSLPIQRKK